MSPDETGEITAAAIARLAGVGRAAVSNWRRRYPQFPQPVGGTRSSPTFSRIAVEAWLAATGKAHQLATAGRTETGTQSLDGASSSDDEHCESSWRSSETTAERGVADLTAGQMMARAMVSLLPRSTSASAEDADAPVVLDPACADATRLMAVADRFGDHLRLVGQEADEPTAATAALNLRSAAHDVSYEIHVGDSLLDNRLSRYLGTAAAVVCDLPSDHSRWPSAGLAADPRWRFGTPERRDGELAWVQHCYAFLRPGGVAVVAMSLRMCVQPSGRHVRAALVQSGVLREVIALPRGFGSLSDAQLCLWVLRRSGGTVAPPAVRMIDVSGVETGAEVPQDFAAWQQLFANADGSFSRSVLREDLLDGDTELLPSRHVTPVEVRAEDLSGVTARLQAVYARIGRGLPSFVSPAGSARHDYVTVAELERSGALTILSRDATPRAGDLLLRTMGRPPVVATGTAADDSGVAQVVELDASLLDGDVVAMFLRAELAALPVANTLGAPSREDLRRCRLPRMSRAEQRRYGEEFRRLRELADALQTLATVSENVIEKTVHGLISGVLSPGAAHDEETD
ncbi:MULTISPECIES: N-6 DNA methylase [Actinoalloteichus]|uniref:N-6 DNA methylase n=1 Tax=Actinoalloteichus TaxID=65496 RepID=UPI0012F7D242|nr:MULTISPECIES: N-6 DNA methylase [Actinoalloteichus]